MRQLVQDLRSGKVEIVELPEPVVRPGTVLVSTTRSLISAGTEQAVASAAAKGWIGKARERPDAVKKVIEKARADGIGSAAAAVRARLDDLLTPGYSSAGVVEAVGEGVEHLHPGQRVACVGANAASHAGRVVVPAPLCVPIPGGVEDAHAAFAAVGAIAAHGIRTARVEAGSVVAVVGLGLVGQLAAQLATAAGARVVGIDVEQGRVDLARSLGAVGGAVGNDAAAAAVAAASDGFGADAVVITAATKDSGLLDFAAEIARDRATVCVVGDVPLTGSRTPYYLKELELRVSRSYGPGRYDDSYEADGHDYPIGYVRWTERRLIRYFLEEIAAGRVRVGELITHEFPIEQGIDAYAALSDPARLGIVIRYAEETAQHAPRAATSDAKTIPAAGGAVRTGLIGPGTFARATLLPILQKQGVPIVAVAGTTPARSFGVGRRWGAQYAASNADELIADDNLDALVIATRHDSHASLTARALEAGKSVFLEKPLAIDANGLAAVEAALPRGRLAVDFNRDFAPATRAVVEHFSDRRDPISITYRVNAGFLDAGHWTRDPEVGGGRLVGEGCHFVALCSAVVGAPIESVTAVPLGTGPRTLEGDNFVLTLRYTDGSVATITYVATGDPRAGKERYEVHGAGRTAVVDDYRSFELHGGKGTRREKRLRDKGHAGAVASAFRFFKDGGEPPIPYERLIETTQVTLVARDALHRGDAAPQRPTLPQ